MTVKKLWIDFGLKIYPLRVEGILTLVIHINWDGFSIGKHCKGSKVILTKGFSAQNNKQQQDRGTATTTLHRGHIITS